MQRRQQLTIIYSLIGLLGVLLIALVGWNVFKSKGYSVYKNKPKRFVIKYPSSWTFSENKDGVDVIFLSPKETELDTFRESFNVMVQPLPPEITDVDEFVDKAVEQMQNLFRTNLNILSREPVQFAGMSGRELIFLGEGEGMTMKFMMVWGVQAPWIYQMTFTTRSDNYEQYLPVAKKMIRSLKINTR